MRLTDHAEGRRVEETAREVLDKWSSFGTTPDQRMFRYMALEMAKHIVTESEQDEAR